MATRGADRGAVGAAAHPVDRGAVDARCRGVSRALAAGGTHDHDGGPARGLGRAPRRNAARERAGYSGGRRRCMDTERRRVEEPLKSSGVGAWWPLNAMTDAYAE